MIVFLISMFVLIPVIVWLLIKAWLEPIEFPCRRTSVADLRNRNAQLAGESVARMEVSDTLVCVGTLADGIRREQGAG